MRSDDSMGSYPDWERTVQKVEGVCTMYGQNMTRRIRDLHRDVDPDGGARADWIVFGSERLALALPRTMMIARVRMIGEADLDSSNRDLLNTMISASTRSTV